MPDGWIIYAACGVLVCLLLWRVATQWRDKGAEAENLRVSVVIVGVVALTVVVWQCARLVPVGATTADTDDKTITVFAAASLTNALDDVDAAFTKQTGIKVAVSYGASSALAKQIEQGAPADVFASADLQWMDHCMRKKVDTRVNLVGNKLVLIAAKDAKIDHVTIGPGFDLAGDGRVARALCQGCAGTARRMGSSPAKNGHGRKCSLSPWCGRTRPSAARYRL
jgi:hypothetical protein